MAMHSAPFQQQEQVILQPDVNHHALPYPYLQPLVGYMVLIQVKRKWVHF